MGCNNLYKDKANNADKHEKVYKTVQENRKIINDIMHFTALLYKNSNIVFKFLTTKHGDSLTEELNIIIKIVNLSVREKQ